MASGYDLIILGSGSTAFAAALRAQTHGARVLMIEKSELGGTCVNWGCVPSKTQIHASLFREEARIGARIGTGTSVGGVDFARISAHRERVVGYLRQTRYMDVLDASPRLEVVRGFGRFINRREVQVEGKTFTAERFLVATGGFPRIIPFTGLGSVNFLTSRSALELEQLPSSLVIIGGGVIALELGQMYQRFGVEVTVLEHGPRALLPVEREPALAVQEALKAEGMSIHVNVSVCGLSSRNGRTIVTAEVHGERREFMAERLLLAVGTAPASAGIGLDAAGVEVDSHGFVKVDERMQTSAEGISAAGDVTGGMMIATVGAREGVVAVDNMFSQGCGCAIDYKAIPMAIFTDPEVGSVGYGEEEARRAGFEVVTSLLPVAAIPKAHVTGHAAGVIKMIAERDTGRLLGVHLASHRGAELINEAALAVGCKLTAADLANTMHVYPSIGEGLRLCAQGFTRDVSRLSCCAE